MNLDGFDFAKPLPPIKKTLKAKPKAKPKTVEPAPKPKVITNNEAWSVKYVPSKSIDLAVNVKKVGEIKAWLQQNTASKRPGILLLTGPPGCGKTATVKVLAKELQASIQEWSNPTENVTYSQDYSADDIPYVSQTNSFRNFMIRAGKYKLLGGGRHKFILIEDLPPFAIRKTTDFHDIIRHVNRLFPLIFIHSETSGKEDLKKLIFSQDFLEDMRIQEINFNATAPTILTKTLLTIAQAERSSVQDKTVLNSIATSSNGDIRAAINSLQIASITNGRNGITSAVFQSNSSLMSSSKSSAKKKSNQKSEKRSLAVIGGRDLNIDLFHAIGKVLYAKRTEEKESQVLPQHLELQNSRHKLSFDPEELMNNIPMSKDAFTAFLHHSYPDFFTNIKDFSKAAETFSISDPYFHEWTHNGKISLDEYGGLITARGLSFHNIDKSRNFSGMKTFTKPEWYNTIKLKKSRSELMSHYFRTKKMSHSMEEISQTLAPFWSEYFLPALGNGTEPLMEACRFKDMPRKIIPAMDRTVSAMPDIPCEPTEDVDNMIIDDDED